MADPFDTHSDSLPAPARNGAVVTPGASPLASVTKGVYVGGAGNLNVTLAGGQTVLFSGIPAGTILPIRCTHILSTSTTATLIVALW
jgi:hypothetical protein